MQITNDRYWFSEILKRKTEVILDPYLPPFNYLNGSVKNATLFNTIMTDVADLDKKSKTFSEFKLCCIGARCVTEG